MRSTKLWLSVCAIGLTAALFAGCGGDDDSDTTASDTSAEETTAADTTSAAETGDSAACVDAWNDPSNGSSQGALEDLYPDPDSSGNIIAGLEDGTCIVASYTEGDSDYVVFSQSGDAFEETGGGPGEEFEQYRSSVAPVDVTLEAEGQVAPVSP